MNHTLKRRFSAAKISSILVAAVAAGFVSVGHTGSATAAPVTSPVSSACGTWVLQQVGSANELNNLTGQIDAALANPGVVGFSMRLPWKAYDADPTLPAKGLAIAKARGKEFSIRFMAGRHTPDRIFTAGAYSFVSAAGNRTPKPFSDAGVAGNPVFEKEFDATVSKLATWSRANGVKVLHLPWYGFLWSEIYNGDEMEKTAGYSWTAWLEGHRRLAQIAKTYSGNGLAVEFPLSGHWGSRTTGNNETIDMLIGVFGADNPNVLIQGNGMGVTNAKTTNKPIMHAKQMYGTGDYDWPFIYSTIKANSEEYLEVYTQSFSGANKASLLSEAAAFSKAACAVDTMPTVSLTAPASNVTGTVTFSATASAGATVQVLVDGVVVGNTGSVSWDSRTVADGNHTVTAQATDGDGDVATSAAYTFAVDNAPTISIASTSVVEGSGADTQVPVQVSLSKASTKPVTVSFATAGGTATAGSDYATKSGTVTIPAGQTSAAAYVPVTGDLVDEPNETFSVALTNAVNAKLGTASGAVVIDDDDEPLGAAVLDATVTEADTFKTISVPVSLTAPAVSDVTLSLTTEAGSALATKDFTSKTGTVTIPAGSKTGYFTMTLVGDRKAEAQEWFKVRLTGATGAVVNVASAVVTVRDDD